ncbi:hypothetical protein WN51_02647 [Melipona quadrifasciata]|uniref:Uncharacterized protein n=1 Tax=Melipona quadrifasciata TaxID=166423 RepID=A0A0N0BDT8_9HYME|nr:hypothetical protein WN51_02647 [Melipona quadrifasciata]
MVRVGQYIGGTSREGGSAKGLVHEENTRSRKEKARGEASRKRRGRRKVEENRARRRGGGERRSKRRREHRGQGEKERVATTIEGEWRKHLPAARGEGREMGRREGSQTNHKKGRLRDKAE